MRDDLHCLSQVQAFSLVVYHGLVYPSGGHVVGLGGRHVQKPLIVAQVKVCLRSVIGDITLPVLVRIERSRVHIDIRVKLLDSHPEPPGLKKFCK